MHLEPYVHFDGRCEEAIEFYKTAAGARVEMLMRFKDIPASAGHPPMPPETQDKVMHASLRIGDSRLLVSDGRCTGAMKFEGFSLTLNVANEAEADRAFNALGQGGTVSMPLAKTFFSPRFGMLNDRFGVSWIVIVQQAT
jgi:PhnB protein